MKEFLVNYRLCGSRRTASIEAENKTEARKKFELDSPAITNIRQMPLPTPLVWCFINVFTSGPASSALKQAPEIERHFGYRTLVPEVGDKVAFQYEWLRVQLPIQKIENGIVKWPSNEILLKGADVTVQITLERAEVQSSRLEFYDFDDDGLCIWTFDPASRRSPS